MLTFVVPLAKFLRMVRDMDESFLITESWAKVRRPIGKRAARQTTPSVLSADTASRRSFREAYRTGQHGRGTEDLRLLR